VCGEEKGEGVAGAEGKAGKAGMLVPGEPIAQDQL
jgi:hypothetical protein